MSNIERASTSNPLKSRRGRPLGSKNKPKTVVVAESLEKKIGPYLPKDDLNYLLGTLEGKTTPELAKDIDLFLALQLKALLPVLADEIKSGQLSREATSRSGTVKELLAIRFQMEKAKNGESGTDQRTFIQNIFLSRGLDGPAIAALIGSGEPPRQLPEPLPKRVDGDEQEADSSGSVPDELP